MVPLFFIIRYFGYFNIIWNDFCLKLVNCVMKDQEQRCTQKIFCVYYTRLHFISIIFCCILFLLYFAVFLFDCILFLFCFYYTSLCEQQFLQLIEIASRNGLELKTFVFNFQFFFQLSYLYNIRQNTFPSGNHVVIIFSLLFE